MTMALQDRLDEWKAESEAKMTPGEVAISHRATADLIKSGQAERALKAGDRAPSFTLTDTDGALVSSSQLLAKGPLVVVFYRGVWCRYCNFDLQALEQVASDIRTLGASLVALSMQTAANSRKSHRDNKLSFPILRDERGELAAEFGIRHALPDDLIQIYKGKGADLPAFNGEPSWTLPMPSRFVIGRDGVITFAEISADYTRRPEPSQLLPVLQRMQQSTAA
jgi:peroxiredoxin